MILINNNSSEYRIIYGENAGEAVVFAAKELSDYINKITGVEIPVFSDEIPAEDNEILVGATNREEKDQFNRDELGFDGFTLRTLENRLFIIGGSDRSTLYGVYELLETYLGCRFYTSNFERIPTKKNIELPDINDTQKPTFISRGVFWLDYLESDALCAKHRTNSSKARSKQISAKYGGGDNWAGPQVHTLYNLAEMTGDHIDQQPCLSDEKVFETVLKNVRAELAKNPDANLISVSQNDSNPSGVGCMCEKCKAVLEETGSYAGSIIRFVNRIADAIKDEYPNVTVHTFAYRYTRRPPIGVVPRDNVTVELCSIEGCFRHPLEECHVSEAGDALSDDFFSDLLVGWGKLCPRLSLWDYTTDYMNYNLTFPNFTVLRKNVRLFADHGVSYVFEQGNYQSKTGEFAELRSYLLAKLLWDPYMSAEKYRALAEEFIDDYYGNGAPYIKEYLSLVLKATENIHATIYINQKDLYPEELREVNPLESYPVGLTADMVKKPETADWKSYFNYYNKLLPNVVYTEGKKLFEQALLAEKDEVLKEHIGAASVQIMSLESEYYYRRLLCVKDNLENACAKVLENVVLSEEEKNNSINAAITYAMEELWQEYEEYNRNLHDTLKKYNITHTNEAVQINAIREPNYRRTMIQWNRRDDDSIMERII